MPLAKLYVGDAADALGLMAQDGIKVGTVVTSPPYWGLIDYEDDAQLGQESDPARYIARLVRIFGGSEPIIGKDGKERKRPAGVWDVLADDGLLFVNIGDTYAKKAYKQHGIKKKDLCGIPEWFQLAMKKAGWWLRSKIVWEKGNANPETAPDRPSRSHEDIFMFAKSDKYVYDGFSIREAGSPLSADKGKNGRNARTVWRINTKGKKFTHFAAFPPELPERLIRVGTSHRGRCGKCGKPWTRIVKKERYATRPGADTKVEGMTDAAVGNRDPQRHVTAYTTEGWKKPCQCGEQFTVADAVLDPFAGTGTTLVVANRLGRDAYGIELVDKYAAEIVRALEAEDGMFGSTVEQVVIKPKSPGPKEGEQDAGANQQQPESVGPVPRSVEPAPGAAADDRQPVHAGGGEGAGTGAAGVADADPRPE